MSTSLHGCIHQQLNNARKLCQITIRLKHRSTPLLFAICSLLPSVPPYTKRGRLSNQSPVLMSQYIRACFRVIPYTVSTNLVSSQKIYIKVI